jgi:hypothetical protein
MYQKISEDSKEELYNFSKKENKDEFEVFFEEDKKNFYYPIIIMCIVFGVLYSIFGIGFLFFLLPLIFHTRNVYLYSDRIEIEKNYICSCMSSKKEFYFHEKFGLETNIGNQVFVLKIQNTEEYIYWNKNLDMVTEKSNQLKRILAEQV